jgi:hypothetical protein
MKSFRQYCEAQDMSQHWTAADDQYDAFANTPNAMRAGQWLNHQVSANIDPANWDNVRFLQIIKMNMMSHIPGIKPQECDAAINWFKKTKGI